MTKDIHICNSDEKNAFQDYYPDDYSHCFGCGRLNEQGLQIKSFWDGDESVCRFLPKNHFTGGRKDILYGGLIASLMDCHGAGTAAAAKLREQGIEIEKGEMPKFVTASMKVDYLAPTPVDTEIELRGKVKEIKGRKVIVDVSLAAGQKICAKGELIFVQLRE
ncbi:Thioesterase superfamily domain-containing protein [Desulfonema limicola]|uniref:Thioesterase superfamily domain-containing protein n=1 Tax=Desulfonema limicola TaxID=45656 RepID=A0A975GGY0_9BACT|nr:PaaI family thioesterase [Desulfonema limicola]QTA80712.1 Thioesterase superfamily domain-containing protein [Desulfonema limicola]